MSWCGFRTQRNALGTCVFRPKAVISGQESSGASLGDLQARTLPEEKELNWMQTENIN